MVPVFDDLLAKGVKICSFVADNENVMNKLGNLLVEKYDFLIRVPCTAHVIQLVVHKALKLNSIKWIIQTAVSIVKEYDTNKRLRNKLKQVQDDHQRKRLIKPNATRWSSELLACQRLLQLKQYIQALTPQTNQFWRHLEYLCEFLEPFQKATDVIQQDRSSLVDVYHQFIKLLQHCASLAQHELLSKPAANTKRIINKYWNSTIKKEAVIASAILGMESTDMFSDIDIFHAHEFIVEHGAKYVTYYKIGKSSGDADSVTEALNGQLHVNCLSSLVVVVFLKAVRPNQQV